MPNVEKKSTDAFILSPLRQLKAPDVKHVKFTPYTVYYDYDLHCAIEKLKQRQQELIKKEADLKRFAASEPPKPSKK